MQRNSFKKGRGLVRYQPESQIKHGTSSKATSALAVYTPTAHTAAGKTPQQQSSSCTPEECMLGEGPGDDGSHPHVCEQHVLLDKEVGGRLHVGAGGHRVAARVERKVEARVVEAQRTRLEASLAQAGGDAVEGQAVILDLHSHTVTPDRSSQWRSFCQCLLPMPPGIVSDARHLLYCTVKAKQQPGQQQYTTCTHLQQCICHRAP